MMRSDAHNRFRTWLRSGRSAVRQRFAREDGIAVLIAVVALSMFSLVGLYGVYNATTELRVSDNFEGSMEASYAAQAGITHARELLKGLRFDDLLVGPDGTYNNGASNLSTARTVAFRNPIPWTAARSVDILNPTVVFAGVSDDGIMNTGKVGATPGIVLIPQVGLAQTAPNPYGQGTITTSRYFVKVSDNNGEATEVARDPADNPFVDGDGIIIVRSFGISGTIRENAAAQRNNSVAVFEARYRVRKTFNLDAPLLIQGSDVLPSQPSMFSGNSFRINGGGGNVGIGAIDTNAGDGIDPAQQISNQLRNNQYDNVTGMGLRPSVSNLTGTVTSDPDKAMMLDPEYLYNFVTYEVPQFADSVYQGNQSWGGGNTPYIGSYNTSLPPNDPSQDPKVTLVNGDLDISGNITGGGLLVVTGKLGGSGSLIFNGLILVIGSGELDFSGINKGITGGIYVVTVTNDNGNLTFGTPHLSLEGHTVITIDSDAISMAVRLIPPVQLSWREVTSSMDP